MSLARIGHQLSKPNDMTAIHAPKAVCRNFIGVSCNSGFINSSEIGCLNLQLDKYFVSAVKVDGSVINVAPHVRRVKSS